MYYAVEYANGKPIRVYGFKSDNGRKIYIKMHDDRNIHTMNKTVAEEYISDGLRYEEF